jgi:hypothetical protein
MSQLQLGLVDAKKSRAEDMQHEDAWKRLRSAITNSAVKRRQPYTTQDLSSLSYYPAQFIMRV